MIHLFLFSRICCKTVTHDHGKLTTHFIKAHPNTTLEEYYEKIVKIVERDNVVAAPVVEVKQEMAIEIDDDITNNIDNSNDSNNTDNSITNILNTINNINSTNINRVSEMSNARRTQLESYLKAWKIEGVEGIGKLLALQTSDPKNASLYEEMIWLLSSPEQEPEPEGEEQKTPKQAKKSKKNKRRPAMEVTTCIEENDEEMVVVKPEFDVETYGNEFDNSIVSNSRSKRRKLSDDLAGMITPPNTPPEKRQKVNHPTPLSEVPDDGKPWYDGCEYQCNFCPLATKHVAQISNHLKNYHKKSGLGRGEGYVADETTIECKICAVSMMRNVMQIKMHLNRHGITLEEYGERYIKGSASGTPEPKVLIAEDNGNRDVFNSEVYLI